MVAPECKDSFSLADLLCLRRSPLESENQEVLYTGRKATLARLLKPLGPEDGWWGEHPGGRSHPAWGWGGSLGVDGADTFISSESDVSKQGLVGESLSPPKRLEF